MTTVADIVRVHLQVHGFDGLVSEARDCACLSSDLFPCGAEGVNTCEPGYRTECGPDDCPLDGECDFHITTVKP